MFWPHLRLGVSGCWGVRSDEVGEGEARGDDHEMADLHGEQAGTLGGHHDWAPVERCSSDGRRRDRRGELVPAKL